VTGELGKSQLQNGQINPNSLYAQITAMNALEVANYPITVQFDLDRDDALFPPEIAVVIDRGSMLRRPDLESEANDETEVWQFRLLEKRTSVGDRTPSDYLIVEDASGLPVLTEDNERIQPE
jgi:hypothetical protein